MVLEASQRGQSQQTINKCQIIQLNLTLLVRLISLKNGGQRKYSNLARATFGQKRQKVVQKGVVLKKERQTQRRTVRHGVRGRRRVS